jgi:hypothetical protein
MPLPTPHVGLVISYSYLWAREHHTGQEEGMKHRPCAIVVARRIMDDKQLITVVAITHGRPIDPTEALEIPPSVKRLLGLDDLPSWIILNEVNDFIWPGPDLAQIPGSDTGRFDYGVLPPGFFRILRDRFIALRALRGVAQTPRSE